MSLFHKQPTADLSIINWHQRTDAALDWLRRSIAVHGGRGSAHSYSPLFGWARAYPETTGYLLDTLFDYASLKKDASLRQDARTCADWLVSIQLPNGAFPGLLAGHTQPSVFNTAQILFGLTRIIEESGVRRQELKDREEMGGRLNTYQVALRQAVDWLLSILETDGSWRLAAYVPGFVPTYYTRAVWGVLRANAVLQNAEIERAMHRALHFYAGRFLSGGAIQDWGFWPDKPAFTHTIAYTLEGFLESAVLLQEADILQKTIRTADFLGEMVHAKGQTAGRYDLHWRGDYSFHCVTGNAQLSVVFHRLFALTQVEKYQQTASFFLAEIIDSQSFSKNKNRYGALPGSAPLWGPYLRGRYPNWAAKFFLDAVKLEVGKLEF